MRLLRFIALPIALTVLLLNGCVSDQPAPVIERAPMKSAAAKSSAKSEAGKDWRPDTHTVKKGDTLFSIGLEYGYDYKEIAQINNIAPPYIIHVGQKLSLKVTGAAVPAPAPKETVTDNGVVITPLKLDGVAPAPAQAVPPASAKIQVLAEPKALRVPYSEAALTAPVPAASSQPTAEAAKPEPDTATAETKPEPAKTDTESAETGDVAWIWPTKGKVIAGFNDSTNAKGIDIAGDNGQPVLAAAPGKVIYSGADLRGYGKLVIIKHNKTFLSVYAHNSQILVKEGQQVKQGQKIAEMGSSDTNRVKLHFEIRQQGKSVDPAKFLAGTPG
jgi:lipoprotein NlpD